MTIPTNQMKPDAKLQDRSFLGIAHNIENQTKPLQTLLRKFSNDWSMNLSAALAYNLLLAIFPLLVALLAVLGLLLGRFGGTATNFVLSALPSAFPNNLNPIVIITAVEQNLKHSSGLLGLIAVLSAIFGGSRLFIFLESCFCIIYRVRPRPFVRQNLMAIGMFLLFLLLVPIMVLASSVPALAFSLLHNTWLGRLPLLTTVAGFLGGLIASFILFEFIYVVVPNQDIRLGHGWLGAIVAAVALQLYVLIFPLYSSHFLIGVAGAVGLGAILIVFFYYFAVIMLLGAEVNSFFAEGVQPLPNDVATFVSTMGGRLNDDSPTDEAKAHVDSRPTEKADKEHVVDFVLETQEPDVPPRVAQDPKVQEEVLQRQRRGSSNTEMNE